LIDNYRYRAQAIISDVEYRGTVIVNIGNFTVTGTSLMQERIETKATLRLLHCLQGLRSFCIQLSAAHGQQLRELDIVRPLVALGFNARGEAVRIAAKVVLEDCLPEALDSFNGPKEPPPNPNGAAVAAAAAAAAAPPQPPPPS
jgi:hypothetical protein